MRAFLAAVLLLVLAAPAQGRIDRDFFDGRGFRTLSVGAFESGAEAIIRTRNGKLLIAGWADQPKTYADVFGFARVHPSGRLDRRFGRNGRALVAPGAFGAIVGLRELPNRKLMFAFAAHGSQGVEYCVARLHANGKLDRGYGERGIVRIAPPAAGGSLVGMAVEPGGSVVLAGNVGEFLSDRRVVVMRVQDSGSYAEMMATLDLGGSAVDVVRTRLGRVVVAANRVNRDGRLTGSVLAALGHDPPRHEIERARIVRLGRDGGPGVSALLTGGSRWGVRRFTEDLEPRRAPAPLTLRGRPSAFTVTSGGASWVALSNGAMRRVRIDGTLDPRGSSGRLRSRYMIDTRALVPLPRNRVGAAGTAFPEDLGDIREDYGPSRMWVGRFRLTPR